MKRLFAAAAVLASFTQAAVAGELIFFSEPGMHGNQVTVQRDARNLTQFGFNDAASSAVVRSGTWELCEHADFGGNCAVFERGEYPNLRRFNNKVSSARQLSGFRDNERGRDRERSRDERVGRDDFDGRRDGGRDSVYGGSRDGGRDGYRDERGGRGDDAIQLFADARFEGPSINLSNDLRNFNQANFNDKVSSLIIREGRWELCEHADYRGQCVVYGPGRYSFVEQMNDRFSSMRRVR
jgi:hypothetical protein